MCIAAGWAGGAATKRAPRVNGPPSSARLHCCRSSSYTGLASRLQASPSIQQPRATPWLAGCHAPHPPPHKLTGNALLDGCNCRVLQPLQKGSIGGADRVLHALPASTHHRAALHLHAWRQGISAWGGRAGGVWARQAGSCPGTCLRVQAQQAARQRLTKGFAILMMWSAGFGRQGRRRGGPHSWQSLHHSWHCQAQGLETTAAACIGCGTQQACLPPLWS